MIQTIWGIDTSCYLTSCAIVDIDGRMIADVRQKLRVPQGKRGLRQNEAVFQHVKQLPSVLAAVFSKVSQVHLNVACASNQPLQGINSYMPDYAGDNAVGVALLGLEQYRHWKGNQHGNHSQR